MKLKATSFIAGIAIAASVIGASAGDLEYAQRVAEQAPAVEQCVADAFNQYTNHGDRVAKTIMDKSFRATDAEMFSMDVEGFAYIYVREGNMTAAQGSALILEVHACVTY